MIPKVNQISDQYPDDIAIRRLAGGCYLSMRTGDGHYLPPRVTEDALVRSGLQGAYANLCVRLGIETDRNTILKGMQLAAINKQRWGSLATLLDRLATAGIEPVVFKGGAVHARWPEMRELRALFDYDLIVPQKQIAELRKWLEADGFDFPPAESRLTRRLSKGSMVWKGQGLGYQNLDIHARVTEPPVCNSLTRSILDTTERADGVRVPDIEDCVCMIALHIVRSGMYRPLREYIDLLWYVDEMDDDRWRALRTRASRHDVLPALFVSLRQARHCLALDELAPDRAMRLTNRIADLEGSLGRIRRRVLDALAPAAYPLRPIESRNHPLYRRSLILGAGTSATWRVATAFLLYGASRLGDRLNGIRDDHAVA